MHGTEDVVLGDLDVSFADVPQSRHVMAVMGGVGDTKLQWDPTKPAEVEAARNQFDFLTKQKKYRAFRMDDRDEVGDQIHEFDPQIRRSCAHAADRCAQ